MSSVKLSLIDYDYKVSAETLMKSGTPESKSFMAFINQIREDLATGQSAVLEVQCGDAGSMSFRIAHSA